MTRAAHALAALVCVVASAARADVPMPPPTSCPDGARPMSVAHYDSWCEAVTCTDDDSCTAAMGGGAFACKASRGLCVRDRDVAGVGWASGHVQHLHEALSGCTSQSDCRAGTTCERVPRCERILDAPFVATSGSTWFVPCGLGFGGTVVAGGLVAVLLLRRRKK